MTPDDLIAMVGVTALVLSAFLWIVFFFYSVRRIEKRIVLEGKPRPCQWDPIAWRAFLYGMILTWPKKWTENNQILNASDVTKYANRKDGVIAWLFIFSSYLMLLMVIIGTIFDYYK